MDRYIRLQRWDDPSSRRQQRRAVATFSSFEFRIMYPGLLSDGATQDVTRGEVQF